MVFPLINSKVEVSSIGMIIRDAAGNLVGERVLAVFPGPWEAVVLATDGSRLHSVQSPSIRHVLEFERRSDQ